MWRYRVNQHLIVLNLYRVSINEISHGIYYVCNSHGIYYFESFTESKLDVRYVNAVKLTT